MNREYINFICDLDIDQGRATVSVETRAVMDQTPTTVSTVSTSAWAAWRVAGNRHVMWCHVMSCDEMLCCCYIIMLLLYYVLLLCYVLWCYGILLCYVIIWCCDVMLCYYVMSCILSGLVQCLLVANQNMASILVSTTMVSQDLIYSLSVVTAAPCCSEFCLY